MTTRRLLIVNRGEVAVRIMRTAAELGFHTVAMHSDDDAASLHVARADSVLSIPGRGAAAYLDAGAIVDAALREGCWGVHPGYGFLAEQARFGAACESAGLVFVVPRPRNWPCSATSLPPTTWRANARCRPCLLLQGSPPPAPWRIFAPRRVRA